MDIDHALERHRLISVSDAARLCGVHPQTIRRWTQTGLLEEVRLPSGSVRVRVSDVHKILEGSKPSQ